MASCNMLPLIFLCVLKLATGAIDTQIFYNINDEHLTRANRDPKILRPSDANENMISIHVHKPSTNEEYYDIEDPVEEVPSLATDNSQKEVNTISTQGRQVVNAISAKLREVQYQPVAVLVQDNDEVSRSAAIYLNFITQNPSVRNDFWLMKFNASGVSNVLAKTSGVESQTFNKLLLAGSKSTKQSIGLEGDSSAVFFSILKATRILPFGSAILLFVNTKVEDEDLAQIATRETQNKQIRILTVWQGAYPTLNQEEKLIREATISTRGSFFIGNTERKSKSDTNYLMTVNGKANPVITHLTNIHGQQRVQVPIEDGVSAVHVSISNNVNRARFYTPQGYLIDLLNITSVERFARDSYVVKTGETFEIELAIGGFAAASAATRVVGVWRLETDAFAQHHYDIIVSVRHDLTVESNFDLNTSDDKNESGKKRRLFHLNLIGEYAKIENVTLVTSNGVRINNNKLRINIEDNVKNADDIETFKPGGQVNIDLDGLPQEQVYIQVNGKDKRGHNFQRVSYFNPRNIHNIVQPTIIELGAGSELYQVPGKASFVLYEVTNNRDNVVFMRFEARDERSYLRKMTPQWAWLNPHQKLVVTLTTISQGGNDQITFTSYTGSDRVDKSVILRSGDSTRGFDDESPHMWHTFTSTCQEAVLGRCEDHSWTLEVTAQDRETGLLLITSSPEGLYFPNGYVSGTTEEVTGILSGSCCRSSVSLTAIDVVNNRRSYVADAYWTALGSGAVAAIVLAILLIIAIIVLIVYCVVCGRCKCTKQTKNADSYNLPTSNVRYRGPPQSETTPRY